MKKPEKIDHLVRKALDDWSVEPPRDFFPEIGTRLGWYNFWHFRLLRGLKVVLLSLTGALFLGLMVLLSLTDDPGHGSSLQPTQESVARIPNRPVAQGKAEGFLVSDRVEQIATLDPVTEEGPDHTQPGEKQPNLMALAESPQSNGYRSQKADGLKLNPSPTPDQGPDFSGEKGEAYPFGYPPSWESMNTRESTDIGKMPVQTTPLPEKFMSKTGAIPQRFPQSSTGSRRIELGIHLNLSNAFFYPGQDQPGVTTRSGRFSGMSSAGIGYHFDQLFLETGLQFARFSISESGTQLTYNPQNYVVQQWVGQTLQVDTTYSWTYSFVSDSMIHLTDSTLQITYDSSVTDIYENVNQTRFDTLKNKSWTSYYSLLEIPVLAGFKTYKAGFEFRGQGGLLFGILSRTGGKTYDPYSSEGLVPVTERLSSRHFQVGWIVSASLNRYITDNLSLEGSACFRSSFNGFPSLSGLPPKKFTAWGLGFGIRYRINI